MSEELLRLEHLCIDYKVKGGYLSAVHDVSFTIGRGEIFAVVGESGCGKSTVAHSIMDLLPGGNARISGKIFFKGEDLRTYSEKQMEAIRGKEIGMIFQNPLDSLNPVYKTGSQVQEAILLDHVEKQEAWNRVVKLYQDVKMPDAQERAQSYPHELSGGMRQRVMIAMALACKPKLLIADEPTTALDVTIQAQILKLMNDLKAETGTSILFITHDLGVIHEMADEVAVMYCGQIVEKASARTIFHDGTYSHPYTEGLMTSIPQLNTPKGEKLDAIPGSVPNPLYLPQGCKFAPRCKYCTKKCQESEPELHQVEPGHVVRCFYPEKAVRKEHGE